jgi:hypothetical protein
VPVDGNEDRTGFSPDGLTEQIIDSLLRQVGVAAGPHPQPTSALTDGTAVQRRYRSKARHSVAAVMRALPPRRGGASGAPRGRHRGWGGGGMTD